MKRKIGGIMFCVAPLALAISSAFALEDEDQKTKNRLEEVIVTGVVRETSKADATFSINTLKHEDIQRFAPISTADLLQNIPGIYAEGSTAGEASNNITVRGLPVTGGYRYAPQLIDGLPWYEEPEVQFMNNDVAVRTDLMTERVEVVKGGTGGILYSNGLGATINYVTRTGSQEFEGGYKLELTDYGLVRNEGFVSGPINENLTFAIGGFYRTSDGIRDMGFTADNGGQVRGNLVYTSDDGMTEVQFHGLAVRDKTAFYQNVPFQVPRLSQPGTADNPTKIDQDTIRPIGIDFGDGTVVSPYTRNFQMLGEYGQRDIDLADGINPEFDVFTFKLDHELESGVRLSAGVRHTSGSNGFNAMFTGNDSTYASIFNNARYQNDLVSAAHGQALRGEYDAAKLQGYFNVPDNPEAVFPGISREDFVNNYAIAQSVGAFYLDNGSQVADDTIVNFLLPFVAQVDAESTSVDLKAQTSFEFAGTHDLTFGLYGSSYTNDQNFQAGLYVSSMEARSRLADLRALDANGNSVGPSLTRDAGILPGWFGYVSDITAKGRAYYFLDHWETMGGKLKMDFGVRWQEVDATVVRRERNAITDITPASVEVGSAADTTADNEVHLPGSRRVSDDSFDGFGWSFGANYAVTQDLAVYGLISNSFRLPSLEDLNEFRVDSRRSEEQVEDIWQYEAGVRYYADTWDTQIALFYNDFAPRENVNVYRDFNSSQCATPGSVPDINTCPEVRQTFMRGIENVGVEIEAAWRPEFLEGLELRGNVVFQQPEIQDANFTVVNELTDGNGVVTGYEYVQVGEDGRTPRRLAEFMLNVQGSYDMKPLTGWPIKPYFKYSYFDERFSESGDFNVTLYPEYFHLDAGVIVDFSDKLALQVHVSNITNELSFTEGDPIFFDLLGPNGDTNRGVGRPLFGRSVRANLTYWF